MKIWIDAQLSPALALWINQSFSDIQAQSVRALGLRDANDEEIFQKAKEQNVTVMTKDFDFVSLLERSGPPPQIILITAGNTTNVRMKEILTKHLSVVLRMLENGEQLVEISGN